MACGAAAVCGDGCVPRRARPERRTRRAARACGTGSAGRHAGARGDGRSGDARSEPRHARRAGGARGRQRHTLSLSGRNTTRCAHIIDHVICMLMASRTMSYSLHMRHRLGLRCRRISVSMGLWAHRCMGAATATMTATRTPYTSLGTRWGDSKSERAAQGPGRSSHGARRQLCELCEPQSVCGAQSQSCGCNLAPMRSITSPSKRPCAPA